MTYHYHHHYLYHHHHHHRVDVDGPHHAGEEHLLQVIRLAALGVHEAQQHLVVTNFYYN